MDNTENRFKYEGVWYSACDSYFGCDGCAGCGNSNVTKCVNFPNCTSKEREDGRNVIFVKSDADNFGDEE